MDTVVIKIYKPAKFRISNFSQFQPEFKKRTFEELSVTERSSTRSHLQRFTLRPKWQERYLPRVEILETLSKDRQSLLYILKIEFSVPKLLYGNSLLETKESDSQKVFSTLSHILKSLDIEVNTTDIENATVTTVHVCKNLFLPSDIRMRELIDEMARMDINKAFDVSDRQHKKGTRVLNFHSGTIDWSIYDKISDSLRPRNKRTDKNHISQEREIVMAYGLQDHEVFRYEYRIKKGQTVKREINKTMKREPKTKVIFKDLFTPNLMKIIVLNSWSLLFKRPENQLLLFRNTNKLELFMHLLSENKKNETKAHSLNNTLALYGLTTAIQDFGAKEVRGAIFNIWNKDHPERLTKTIKLASDLVKNLPHKSNLDFIDSGLKKFEHITITTLETTL